MCGASSAAEICANRARYERCLLLTRFSAHGSHNPRSQLELRPEKPERLWNRTASTPVDATPKEKSDIRLVTPAARATNALEQHEPDVLGAHLGALPVVEVVLEVPIPNTELQILEELP